PAPSQFSTGTGASRIAASTVPSTSAPIADSTVSWIVVQKAWNICPLYSLKTCTWSVGSIPVDGGRCRGVDAGVTQVHLERPLPLPVLLHLLDRGVDLLFEFGVALRQADAVPLLGERLPDHPEVVRALRRITRQDHL